MTAVVAQSAPCLHRVFPMSPAQCSAYATPLSKQHWTHPNLCLTRCVGPTAHCNSGEGGPLSLFPRNPPPLIRLQGLGPPQAPQDV